MSKVVLIDGTSYIFRAFHALPRLTNAQGVHTGALYGFCSMFKKLLADYEGCPMVLFFDAGGPNFRHALYADYKSHREAPPAELQEQFSLIYEVSALFGVPIVQQYGVEADDFIGTVAQHYAQFASVVIASLDKDFCQLVGPQICLEASASFQVQTVLDKYGVRPDQFIDYLALIGDASDHIPGVPKVGPVTAAKWLNEFGSLAGLIAAQDQLKGKVADSFRAHVDLALLSQQLARIEVNLPWPEQLPLDHLPALPTPDLLKLAEYYERFDIKGLLPKMATLPLKAPSYEFYCIDDQEGLKRLQQELQACPMVAVDIETTSLDPHQGEICGVAVCASWQKSYYIACRDPLLLESTLAWLKQAFARPDQCWIAHHWKFEAAFFFKHFSQLPCSYEDTMLLSYVLQANKKHDLKSLSLNHCHWELASYSETIKGYENLSQVPLEQATRYAASDAAATWRLYHYFIELLDKNPSLKTVYEQIDKPLAFVLMKMEYHGISLDPQVLVAFEAELKTNLATLSGLLQSYTGDSFNMNSPKQLRELLFGGLGLTPTRKTPKGEPSTDEDALLDLKDQHPVIPLILEYRQLEKLRSTYTTSLLEQVNAQTNRVHTSYHQSGTITGRLSSTAPNLQNIPIKTHYGRKIRSAFVARPGWVLLSADYSQIELRLMAHFSQDPTLLQAYQEGRDIHKQTAMSLYGCAQDQVSYEQRQVAKTVNFGLIYGMSAWGLARQLHIARDQAQHFIDTYFQQYPGVRTYMERMKQFANEHGYVQTLSGRHIPIERSQSSFRAAINGPLQGTASDLMKRAMIAVDQALVGQDSILMLLQVHDELIFEVKEQEAPAWALKIQELMEQALSISVPLVVNCHYGRNWAYDL